MGEDGDRDCGCRAARERLQLRRGPEQVRPRGVHLGPVASAADRSSPATSAAAAAAAAAPGRRTIRLPVAVFMMSLHRTSSCQTEPSNEPSMPARTA